MIKKCTEQLEVSNLISTETHELTDTECTVGHPPEHGGQCRICSRCGLFIAPKEFNSKCKAREARS